MSDTFFERTKTERIRSVLERYNVKFVPGRRGFCPEFPDGGDIIAILLLEKLGDVELVEKIRTSLDNQYNTHTRDYRNVRHKYAEFIGINGAYLHGLEHGSEHRASDIQYGPTESPDQDAKHYWLGVADGSRIVTELKAPTKPASMNIQAILDSIKFRDWSFRLGDDNGTPWLQAVWETVDNDRPHVSYTAKGRKWRLSPHMTKTEVVNTAFLAVKTATEHEVREQFLYDGRPIYNTHVDVDKLHSLSHAIDVRTDPGLTPAL